MLTVQTIIHMIVDASIASYELTMQFISHSNIISKRRVLILFILYPTIPRQFMKEVIYTY